LTAISVKAEPHKHSDTPYAELRMLTQPQFSWLMFEGVVPLFGASLVYLLSGFFKKLAAPGSTFAWKEAVDCMGWLYGALLIAIQSSARFFEAGPAHRYTGVGCIVCGLICGMQLLSAMSERGANSTWQPPVRYKLMAFAVTVIVLWLGYQSHIPA
jgi:hypothetical protein